MNPAVHLLAPLLLLPVSGAADRNAGEARADYVVGNAKLPAGAMVGTLPSAQDSFRSDHANQVRIEERITIRIAPRGMRLDTNVMVPMQNRANPRLVQRKIGRCLAVAGIAGVQPNEGGELILYMRDRRVVSGMLERACRARDFYSGFYLARNGDGKLCVDRDMLLSRNGANCKLTQIRQLVLDD
jgi:hypothetical protein